MEAALAKAATGMLLRGTSCPDSQQVCPGKLSKATSLLPLQGAIALNVSSAVHGGVLTGNSWLPAADWQLSGPSPAKTCDLYSVHFCQESFAHLVLKEVVVQVALESPTEVHSRGCPLHRVSVVYFGARGQGLWVF